MRFWCVMMNEIGVGIVILIVILVAAVSTRRSRQQKQALSEARTADEVKS